MKEYSSPITPLRASREQTYAFLSDFRNFRNVLPSEIRNWDAGADYCSFDVSMIGSVRLVFAAREPVTLIDIVPEGKLPVDLRIQCHLEEGPTAQIVILSDIGGAQEFLFGRILQNLADLMAKHLGQLDTADMAH